MIRYLTKQEIVRLNEATVRVHGGNFMSPYNFLHEENLDYLIEAVQADLFGEPMYPTIADKAAVYNFSPHTRKLLSITLARLWKTLVGQR